MRANKVKKTLIFLLTSIMLLSNLVYAEPGNNTNPALSSKEIEKKIDEFLSILSKDELFSGAVLITKDGKTVYEKACGNASEEHNVPNNINTKFEIASLTKQFTAASVLMLAQQNKLALTDNLSKYIPDYPNGDKITIHNLLVHNSGIAEHTTEMDTDPNFNFSKKFKPEEIIALFKYKPASFQPGERYEYCNSNYILLGYIIEKTSGKSWAQYVTDNIINPLGLANTGIVDRRSVVKNLAVGYTAGDDSVRRCTYIDGSFPYAAGQMYSTVHDLAKWNDALFLNKVLNKEYTEKMLSKHVQFPDSPIYSGYGVFLHNANGRDVVWVLGGTFGFTSGIIRYVDDKTNIVVLGNNDCIDINYVSSTVGDIYNNNKYEMPKPLKLTSLKVKEMESFIGNYASEDGTIKVTIANENNNLFIISEAWEKGKLYGLSEGTLYWKKMNMEMKFQDIKNGKYMKLLLFGGGLGLNRVE